VSNTISTSPPLVAGSPRPTSRVLDASGLSKRYAAVQALDDVGLTLEAGEIHALVGENGSGKSTLVGVVAGTVQRDSGTVRIGDTDVSRHHPRRAQRLGAVTVFQDGSLVSELSVARNLYLGTPPESRPSYSRVTTWAEDLLLQHGFDIDPQLPASELPAGDRQLVEIVRAVASKPRILILDEATSALDSAGVDVVLGLMRDAAAAGAAVLFVTHRLSEVMRVADRVTVLRDGRHQGTHEIGDVNPQRLVELMAGTRVDLEFPDRAPAGPEAALLLACKELRGVGFGPVDLELRAGEIVGVAGADGNGQVPMLRGLARYGEVDGTVTAGDTTIRSYPEAIEHGVVYLSSDRRGESLFAGLTITDNLGLGVLDELSDRGVVRTRRERRFVHDAIERYRIRIGSPSQSPAELSGGNQQKVALSKVLAMSPRVVLIDEPTQGVDVRSRMDIYRFLREIADHGSCVVVVSSDASELAGLCDRILVMSRGKVTSSMPGQGATEESIVAAFAVEHELAIDPNAVAADEDAATQDATPAESPAQPRAKRRTGWRTKISADGLRLVALVALMVLLGAFTQSRNPTFLTELSIFNVMLLALPLVAVAAAQFFVLLVGGIDVSVGATMTLTVVVASSWVQDGNATSVLLKSLMVALVVGGAVGLVNALLVERIGLSPVIATIATLGIASGVALMLRPTAAGVISPELMKMMMSRLGPVPYSLIVLVAVLVVIDGFLRRTGFGLRVRAVGLNGVFARRLGIPTTTVRACCYLVCSILAGVAGMILAAQVGIGDPNAGNSFTLLAIAAPVLGGAALSGGHGSLVGATIGAFILVVAQSLVSVLGLTDGASYIFTGGLTLLALVSSADSLRRLRRILSARKELA
jgi:ABC-type sugar transport system ATPase subunit/ribose/xylose/arabinose/galactoside ABC-type transport system permease subunit